MIEMHEGRQPDDLAILILGYNRPSATEKTLRGLITGIEVAEAAGCSFAKVPIFAALDGPKVSAESASWSLPDAESTQQVSDQIKSRVPRVNLVQESRNRGLPVVLLGALDRVFEHSRLMRVICIEDDVELAPTALIALITASSQWAEPYVITAAPLRGGIPPNQCLLLTRQAHAVTRSLLQEFIRRFELDGRYGCRDHAAIRTWAAKLAAISDIDAPSATSQDAIRMLAWRIADVPVHALPFRLVAHRGLRGQHNTPIHSLRTGILFEQIDSRSWVEMSPLLANWIASGGGSADTRLRPLERMLGGVVHMAYRVVKRFR